MEKPINVVVEDIKTDLYKVLNRDSLPISVITLLVNEVAREVGQQARVMIDNERKQYQDSLAESAENKTE